MIRRGRVERMCDVGNNCIFGQRHAKVVARRAVLCTFSCYNSLAQQKNSCTDFLTLRLLGRQTQDHGRRTFYFLLRIARYANAINDAMLIYPTASRSARYRRLKFRYRLPINSNIRLLPMNAVNMPKSRHRCAKLIPNGSKNWSPTLYAQYPQSLV